MALAMGGAAQEETGPTREIDPLPEVPLSQLSDPGNSALGQAALAVRPGDWRHAETPHFILHFFHNYVAAQVAAELEFYYQAIALELHRDNTGWERKSHVYIFENDADWHAFQGKAQLDPWTGGIHSEGNLFVVRNPAYKFGGRSLGHETAHLVLYRFFGAGIPLWLNEGYAENSSIRLYSGLERRRGYSMLPQSAVLSAAHYIPLQTLTSAVTYPDDVTQVTLFYQESEKLVGFLRAQSEDGFITFMDALSHGSRMDTALEKGFGTRFQSLDALDQEFREYAQRKYVPVAAAGN
ncbi:MAG TPA: hypothetical protein VHY22_12840 [Chthoniobacteraceae bacterium]|nr:hypothetical protein [Chthoniobacteraceae bacterium]